MELRILLVEDEDSIRQFTKINLMREGFEVLEAPTGEDGVEIARMQKPDIVILDIMLPGMDGYEVCRILRQEQPGIGIIMLTAKTQDIDKILGLEQGADDYLVKPFNPQELILRIRSLIRRLPEKTEQDGVINDPPFVLNENARTFTKEGKSIELTPTEFTLLKHFMENPGKAFSRNELLDLHWGTNYMGDTKIVDVNIRRVRTKIEEDPRKPEYLETVWGTGYRWRGES